MGVYWVTGGILLAYLVLVWFLGTWLPLHGSDRWILRGGLAFIGLAAPATFLWFHRKSKAARAGTEIVPADGSGTADIDLLVHEALRRLKNSPLGRGATLRKLPLVFLVGDSGSTKTTTILHSALDPELLAGHVYQDNNILPTRVLNIWYTRQAIFVDVAGSFLAQAVRWKRLVKLVQPGRLSSAMGKGQQAPRAAIVCFDCGNFLQPGASDSALAAARKLAVRLHEISQLLSISFPVYVLFTKLDRVSFFAEFARGLSEEEASQVLGTTLPVRSSAAGVYSEEETRRLTKAFDEIFYSLAEKRLDLLGRENEPDKLPGIYEFPRELRKLRTLLVQFLVDLARPSQLSVNPFLRGFYFSGVRPVIVGDVAPAAPQAQAAEASLDGGATRVFSVGGQPAAQAAVATRAAGSRKVPQWVFLTQLFNDIIVKDRVALAASGFSTRVNLLRRVGLALLALAGVICAVGFLVSFVGNHSLETDFRGALHDVQTVQPPAANQLASLADLQKLDGLRQELVTLSEFERDGAPWHLRWGLYVGDRIYPDARKIYFDRFRQLLLGPTQARLLTDLGAVPFKPGPNDSYEKTYNELKAYLITTSNHEKSTKEFLTPVLLDRWSAAREVDQDRLALARQQFDFYSTELAIANPFSSTNEPTAIERARNYLSQFGGIDRFYLPLLAEASRKYSDVSFNQQFPNSRGVVDSSYAVKGAFTRSGFAFMQDAIHNSSNYLHGEDWVLGKVAASDLNATALQQKLTERYHKDFIEQWRSLLRLSKVVAYPRLEDADKQLDRLTDLSSPLLQLLWFVSNHTNVDASDVSNVFQPVRTVQPPGSPDRPPLQYVLPSNKSYIDALIQLRSAVNTLLQNPTGRDDPALLNQVSNAEGAAEGAAKQVVAGPIDQNFHTESEVYRLLDEPITNVRRVKNVGPVEELNAAGAGLCKQFQQISGKYPFNPRSSEDLPIEQLNSIFAPKVGTLWIFYDPKLKRYLPEPLYEPLPGGTVKLNANFVTFFKHAAVFSRAIYGADSSSPRFSYTLTEMPSNVEGLVLKIGSDTLSGPRQSRTFSWTGAPEEIQVTTKSGDILGSYSGPWSIFKFVSDANSPVSGSMTNLEWILQANGRPIMLPNGKQKSYSYQLQVTGFNPFRSQEWTSMRCVPQVAH
jgi:type VI secretion system protein ImpL